MDSEGLNLLKVFIININRVALIEVNHRFGLEKSFLKI